MSKLDEYILKREEMAISQNWASMIGKRDNSGWASDYGIIEDVRLEAINLRSIKYKDTCYLAPLGLLPFLELSIKSIFSEILETALQLQKKDLKYSAIYALKENEKIIEELKILENFEN